MALKLKSVINTPEDVAGVLRDYYTQGEDGKFYLALDTDPPKLAEFRATNISLMRERDDLKARFDGIDPEAVKADRLKLAELEARPDAAKLSADLAAERNAHAATQLRHAITTEFLRVGGRASAVDYMAGEGAKVFAMEDGKLTSKEFSVSNPTEPLSLGEWLLKQLTVADFAFLPSRGGGAGSTSSTGRFGARASQTVLKNPTPQELGQHAADIATGKIKVEHS